MSHNPDDSTNLSAEQQVLYLKNEKGVTASSSAGTL